MRVVIAARKSDLAKIQAYQVGRELQKKNPDLQVQFHFRESLGDINNEDPLWKMPEKGVFTEDFYKGLLSGEWDMVVHSWKDLPVEDKPGTELAATLPREDQRDLLLFKKSSQTKSKLSILSSSPRRAHNLHKTLPKLLPASIDDLVFDPVRGNIQTRVRKLLEGSADGLIVAKAALDRLLSCEQEEFLATREFLQEALKSLRWMVLPLSLNPTAAAQGALAVEIKKDREDLKKLLATIHDAQTFTSVQEERRQLKGWGGGCHQKIGISILERPYGRITFARGERDNGEKIFIESLERLEKPKAGSYFPEDKKPQWFEREPIEWNHDLSSFNAHWVSKNEALPDDVHFSPEDIVWTSGVNTWFNLARRGIWVNGSAESLGEHEDERIATLAGAADGSSGLRWCKWTHAEAPGRSILATYRLVPRKMAPILPREAVHFYWMSGSSFIQAVKENPWLLEKENWSGPGHTFDMISQELKKHKASGSAHIALNLTEWQLHLRKA
jgi:hydroxymethylbilane synthase